MTETLELLSDTPLTGKEIARYCRICEASKMNIHQLHYLFHQEIGKAVLRLQLDTSRREGPLPDELAEFQRVALPVGFTSRV